MKFNNIQFCSQLVDSWNSHFPFFKIHSKPVNKVNWLSSKEGRKAESEWVETEKKRKALILTLEYQKVGYVENTSSTWILIFVLDFGSSYRKEIILRSPNNSQEKIENMFCVNKIKLISKEKRAETKYFNRVLQNSHKT